MKVYVDELPTDIEHCPFANINNRKCAMTNNKCSLDIKKECEQLITFNISFEPIEEGGYVVSED